MVLAFLSVSLVASWSSRQGCLHSCSEAPSKPSLPLETSACTQQPPSPFFSPCVSGIQRLPLPGLSIFPISLIPPPPNVFAGAQTPRGGTVETTAVLHQGSPVAICSAGPFPRGLGSPDPSERCLSFSRFSWISQPHIRPQLFQPEACKLGHSKPLSLPGTPVSLADVPSLQQALLFSGQSRTAPHPHPLSQHLLSAHRVGCRDA